MAALLLVSFAVGGTNWPLQWLASATNPQVSPFPSASPGLRGLVQSGAWPAAFAIAAGLTFAVWKCARHCPVEKAIAVALAAGLVINVHSMVVDCVLLIPAAAMALDSRRAVDRVLGIGLAMPPAYVAMMSGAAIWVRVGVIALVCVQSFPEWAQSLRSRLRRSGVLRPALHPAGLKGQEPL